jgi:glucokinase
MEKLKQESGFAAIGISAAGPLKNGMVFLTNVTGNYVEFKTPIEKAFKLPVTVINDGAAAVLAEKQFGYGKGKSSVIYITISSGIGGGLIKNEKLVWFPNVKQELGHLKIDSEYNVICKCGGMGHWQAFSSGLSIPNFFKVWMKKRSKGVVPIKYRDVFKLFNQYQKGDKMVMEFFDEVGRKNAKAIDMIAKKYQPEVIVLGGSVAQHNKEVIRAGINKYRKTKIPLEFTNLGDEICLLGAFVYANTVEKNPDLV